MPELTKAQIDANIQIMIQLNPPGLPDGAVVEYYNSFLDIWKKNLSQDRLAAPSDIIYRITLPKPAPHPTLLSIVEHGCFPQDWAEWFAVDQDGTLWCYKKEPEPDLGAAAWDHIGASHRIVPFNVEQPNWKQQCWTLSELRDIIKQNTAQQGSIKRNAVELSEAEQYCEKLFLENERYATIDDNLWSIGKRIAAQREEAQS